MAIKHQNNIRHHEIEIGRLALWQNACGFAAVFAMKEWRNRLAVINERREIDGMARPLSPLPSHQ